MTHVLERWGSSKDIWKVLYENGVVTGVYFVFSDRVSIFDRGPLPVRFVGLGKLRCAIAGKIFQELEKAGFETHYISHDVESARMYVMPFNIKELNIDYGAIAAGSIMPAEFICRLELTKKLIARIEAGQVSRADVERLLRGDAFQADVRLTPGFVECYTKFEPTDRYLTDVEAARVIGQKVPWLKKDVYSIVHRVFSFLENFFQSAGFDLKDGKIELVLTYDGKIILADSVSPDELRLIGQDGRSYDKDPIRQWYETANPDWVAALKVAKAMFSENKKLWPEYPELKPPPELIEDVVGRYRVVAEAIGAV